MLLERTERHVKSALQGERIAMTMAAHAGPKLMAILTNLYNDPMMAVIREYSCNAWDAHVEVDETRPIEIHIARSALDSPNFIVRDYGPGLSVEDFREIYSQYGNSTKDTTNKFIGAFGLGSKSALAYADQFTVIGVKGGVKTTVVFARDDDDGGSLTVVDTCTTDEPSGVEIQVPTTEGQVFYDKAMRFFRFWETFTPGRVLVNGEKPEPLPGLKLSDQMLVTAGVEYDIVVMGGVPYPLEGEHRYAINHGLNNYKKLIVTVPMGLVEPQPSREAFIMKPESKELMEEIRDTLDGLLVAAIQRDIDAAATPLDAVQIMLDWHKTVPQRIQPSDGYTYKGEKLPLRMQAPAGQSFMLVRGDASKLSHKQHIDSYGAASWAKTYWISGFTREGWTPTMRKKLNYYCENVLNLSENVWYYSNFILTDSPVRSRYINRDRRLRWRDIEAIKLPRKVGARAGTDGRIPGSYDMYVAGQRMHGVPADDIDTSLPVFWYPGKLGDWDGNRYAEFFSVKSPDCTIVPLAQNRIAKFERDFPSAKRCSTVVREMWEQDTAEITDYEKLVYAYQNLDCDLKQIKDPELVDDPEIQDLLLYADEDSSKLRTLIKAYASVGHGGGISFPTVKNPERNYPLLSNNYYASRTIAQCPDEVVLYLNASYAARVKREAEAADEAAA